MKRRMLSILLTGALAVSVFAGCGSSASSASSGGAGDGSETAEVSSEIDMNEDPYEVAIQVVVLPGVEIANEAELETAINEITLPAINCTVDLQYVWISEVGNTTSLGIAGNEKLDLIHVATVQPISTMVGSDMLYDMNEGNLLQTHGQKIVEIAGDLLSTGEIDGAQLAVPARVFNAVKKGYTYNKTIADKLGIEVPENGTLDDLEEMLTAVHESGEDIMPYFVGGGTINLMPFIFDYDAFGSEAAYGAVMDADSDPTVVDLYETDLFKDYVLKMQQWREKGIIEKDSTDSTNGQDYFYSQQMMTIPSTYTPFQNASDQASAEQAGFEIGFMSMVDSKKTYSSVTEFMWGIAVNSERPDKAMDFLNFLYSNADVANLIHFGLEGENYEFVDGSADIIQTNGSYLPQFFVGGDERELYIQYPAGEDYYEKCEAMEAEATTSTLIGYVFDDAQYQTEAAALTNVISQYLPTLQNGSCGSEEDTLAYLDDFISALKAAGIDDVIAGNQEQLDAYLAGN